MKKLLSTVLVIATIFVFVPITTRAQEDVVPANPPINDETQKPPQPQVRTGQKPPLTNMPLIRDELRKKVEEAKANQDLRNKLLPPNTAKQITNDVRIERKGLATTTREEVRDIRDEARDNIRAASSTLEKREILKEARNDVFKAKQDKLIKELTLSLNNLKQIRTRVSNRIDKAVSEGKNMTEPKRLLVGADQKIKVAEEAIKSLPTMVPPPVPAVKNASTTEDNRIVSLEKPRQIGEDAIKKIKVAKDALNAVVVSIAKNMGQVVQ